MSEDAVQSIPVLIPVLIRADAAIAWQRAKELALEIGFAAAASDEIALAVKELASNLIDHTVCGGKITLRLITSLEAPGIEIVSLDDGPGIRDPDQAMIDGFSTKAASLGYGLGSVIRLMDQFDIDPNKEAGTGARITCRRWRRGVKEHPVNCPLDIGVATRPHPHCTVNGDAFVTISWANSVLAGIIDGLGHGPLARDAALAARNFVEGHYDRPLEDVFSGAGNACRGTRGVVMALARFDWTEDRVTFASVGNIEARVWNGPAKTSFGVRRGILGMGAPKPEITSCVWSTETTMVLHSDGISSHWRWEDFSSLLRSRAGEIAQGMLRRLGKETDDATVIVIKSKI